MGKGGWEYLCWPGLECCSALYANCLLSSALTGGGLNAWAGVAASARLEGKEAFTFLESFSNSVTCSAMRLLDEQVDAGSLSTSIVGLEFFT